MGEKIMAVFGWLFVIVVVVAAGFFITAGAVGLFGALTGLYTFSWGLAVKVWFLLYLLKLVKWLVL